MSMDMNWKGLTLLSLGALLIQGCGAKKYPDRLEARYTYNMVNKQIAESADTIAKSLSELAAIEKSRQPVGKLRAPLDAEKLGLAQVVSIDWTGPVLPVLTRLAKLVNYRLRTIGNEPSLPILIALNYKADTVADLLRDINFQCATRASIEVYPAHRVIELRYNKE